MKYPENAPGAYFVDTECIACDTCVGLAKGLFALTPTNSHAYVVKQPVTGEEVERCEEARAQCPVLAIGRDS